MKGVQCYELFGGIALKNHTFSLFTRVHCILAFIAVLSNLLKKAMKTITESLPVVLNCIKTG